MCSSLKLDSRESRACGEARWVELAFSSVKIRIILFNFLHCLLPSPHFCKIKIVILFISYFFWMIRRRFIHSSLFMRRSNSGVFLKDQLLQNMICVRAICVWGKGSVHFSRGKKYLINSCSASSPRIWRGGV